MHTALCIPELLYLILKELLITEPGEDDDFHSCAIVCSSWHKVTVQLNQECPQALLPLLRILGGIQLEKECSPQHWVCPFLWLLIMAELTPFGLLQGIQTNPDRRGMG